MARALDAAAASARDAAVGGGGAGTRAQLAPDAVPAGVAFAKALRRRRAAEPRGRRRLARTMAGAVTEARRQSAVGAKPPRVARARAVRPAVAVARAVILARAPRAVGRRVAALAHARAVDALTVARAHEPQGRVANGGGDDAPDVARPPASALGARRRHPSGVGGDAIAREREPADGAHALVAARTGIPARADARAVGAPPMGAALVLAHLRGAAAVETSEAGGARARAFVADLIRRAPADAGTLRARLARPPFVALACGTLAMAVA